MAFYPKRNTSPFLNPMDCPGTPSCPDLKNSSCYWDESLFDCFQDFSSHSQTYSGDFQVNTEVDVSYVTAADAEDHHQDEEHQQGYGQHAALTYDEVEEAGPPARPQEFPTPYLHDGIRTTVRAMDHRTLNVRTVKNVLMALRNAQEDNSRVRRQQTSQDPNIVDKAYLLKKRISRSSYGNRYLSVVLKRRATLKEYEDNDEKLPEEMLMDAVQWESTEEFVTITVSPWTEAIRQHRRTSHSSLRQEGPVHAIAAMQHVGNYHPHVLGVLAVFSDEQHLYTITPYHGGIDLQTQILANREQGEYTPNEPRARVIFTQLLQGLFHLQRKGVCHSNLSLENVYVDRSNQNLVIVDLGRSIRVPYNDPSNFGCLVGETEGTTRRLIQLLPHDFSTHPPENTMFLPPEIVENEEAFDAFAADLWSAACILFVLLVGMAPFKTAHYWDAAYAEISNGNLRGLLASLNINLSEEAVCLLQDMLSRNPRDRLSLAQIMNHEWVKNQRFPSRAPITPTSSMLRNSSSSRLSAAGDSVSTGSSFGADPTDRARLSTGSLTRKTLSKTITGTLKGLLPSSNSSRKRRSSCGGLSGLSSAASSATAVSPSSSKSFGGEEAKRRDSIGFSVLQIPSLE